jgi:hypothetical protein
LFLTVLYYEHFSGEISANGGSSGSNGGGGGGGLITLKYLTGSVYGSVTALGGSSTHDAGASGVIYTEVGQDILMYRKVSEYNYGTTPLEST